MSRMPSMSLKSIGGAVVAMALVLSACSSGEPGTPASSPETPAYLNPDLPVEQRVDDLVSRMTLEEKVSQMQDQAPAIERLGVHEYNWWNEALHGVARAGLATVFPQAIGMAATWDEPLMLQTATVISTEARAKHHEFARHQQYLRYQGLTMWSPNINIFRDPRWGRGQETYGEDPYLTGRMAVQFIRGLQGEDPTYFKTVATVKHFAVHSGPEPERHVFDAKTDPRDFRETYLPMFEMGIREGGAYSLMCAYNRVDGEAACGSERLLTDILREEWGFDGFVVSDCWALDDIYLHHKLKETAAEAAAIAVRSGTDLDCGSEVMPHIVEAVKNGLIGESEIDTAVKRLFTARFRLGMFDPPERVAYAQIPYSVVDQPSHREQALEMTRKSIVLLKNDGVLPLAKDLGKIAVIGPNADERLTLLGNYNGLPSDIVTPLRGIQAAVSKGTEVAYALGADIAEGYPSFETVPAAVLHTEDGEPGLRAEYFDNYALEGEARLDRVEPLIDVNWNEGSPDEGLDADDFGVRWSGVIKPETSGDYQLGLITTLKFEMYLDGEPLVQSQSDYRDELSIPAIKASEAVRLEAGREYSLRIEAHESFSDARARFVWAAAREGLAEQAVAAAEDADAVVLVLGLSPRLEGEEMDVKIEGFRGGDRTRIELPATQQALMQQIVALGKPTVLVLLNGSALAVNWADEHVPAIIEAWYPGQAGGTALAEVLFGDYNPAGRLPLTFYRSVDDLPPFEDYDMDGRTYRYFGGRVLYPFGHGLSYTTFEYGEPRLGRDTLGEGGSTTVTVDVRNTGKRAGDEVVQLYVSFPDSGVERPIKSLKGFQRVHLAAGESRSVRFELQADELRYWSPEREAWVLEPTRAEIQVGASSADIRQRASLTLTGG